MPKLEKVIEGIVAEGKGGQRPDGVEMHMDSLSSIRRGAEEFQKRSKGKVNILINNAFSLCLPFEIGRIKSSAERHDIDRYREHLDLNMRKAKSLRGEGKETEHHHHRRSHHHQLHPQ